MKASDIVADRFLAMVRDELGQFICYMIDERNAQDPDDPWCASHDYCDTNVVMCNAVEAFLGSEFDFKNTCHETIWSEAWTTAIEHGFANLKPVGAA